MSIQSYPRRAERGMVAVLQVPGEQCPRMALITHVYPQTHSEPLIDCLVLRLEFIEQGYLRNDPDGDYNCYHWDGGAEYDGYMEPYFQVPHRDSLRARLKDKTTPVWC